MNNFQQQLQGQEKEFADNKEQPGSHKDNKQVLLQHLEFQKSLNREYFELLSQAEYEQGLSKQQVQDLQQKFKNQEQQNASMQRAIQDKNEQVQDLQQKFENQEQLTQKYYLELSKAETKLIKKDKTLNVCSQQYNDLWHNIQLLHKDFQALLSSRRWKVGNKLIRGLEIIFLQKKQPLAVDHMQNIFAKILQHSKTLSPDSLHPDHCSLHSDYAIQMQSWMNQLCKDFQAIEKSRRWRLGNALVRGVEIATFRSSKPTALNHLQKLCFEFEDCKRNSEPDCQILEKWLRQAGQDFHALRDSVRWRLGNSIFSCMDRLLLRGKKPTAMDHALWIISQLENKFEMKRR